MAQTRWFPRPGVEDLERLRRGPDVREDERMGWDTSLVPSADVIDRAEDVLVRVHLPGVRPGDVEVSSTGDALDIRAERHEDPAAPALDFLRRESTGATFLRTIALPVRTDPSGARAVFEDGVLEVSVPKRPSAGPEGRRVPVGHASAEETRGIPDPARAAVGPEPGGRPKDLRDRTDIRWPGGNLDAEGPYPERPEWREGYMSGGEEQAPGYSATGQAGRGGESHGGFPERRGDVVLEEADLEDRVREQVEAPPDAGGDGPPER